MACTMHTGLCILQAINPARREQMVKSHLPPSISPVQLDAGFTHRSSAHLPSQRWETLKPEPGHYQHNCQAFVQTETDFVQGRRWRSPKSYSSKDRNLLEPLEISPKWGTLNSTCLRGKKTNTQKTPIPPLVIPSPKKTHCLKHLAPQFWQGHCYNAQVFCLPLAMK